MVLAKISTKGQLTIPKIIRQRLNLSEKGDIIGFEITSEGVLIKHLSIGEAEQGYTDTEWKKIEKLALQKGKTYTTAEEAKKHIKKLGNEI